MQIKKRKDNMKIDIRAKDCLYVEIDEWTFYIDNSTDEAIIEKWVTGTNEVISCNNAKNNYKLKLRKERK